MGKLLLEFFRLRIGDPFKSFFLHYSISKEGGFLCPKGNFGEKCAVCEFVSKLWNDGTEESKKMAKDLSKKQRFFTPVLVRGKEEEGPKVWSYSKTVYEFLLKEFVDPENSDLTDVKTGVDLSLEYGKKAGKKFAETTPKFKKKQTPVLKDGTEKEVKEILNKIPDLGKLYSPKTPTEVKLMLDEYLKPEPTESSSNNELETLKEDSEMTSIDKALAELSE